MNYEGDPELTPETSNQSQILDWWKQLQFREHLDAAEFRRVCVADMERKNALLGRIAGALEKLVRHVHAAQLDAYVALAKPKAKRRKR